MRQFYDLIVVGAGDEYDAAKERALLLVFVLHGYYDWRIRVFLYRHHVRANVHAIAEQLITIIGPGVDASDYRHISLIALLRAVDN